MVQDPGGPEDGLFARDEHGTPLAWDRARGAIPAKAADLSAVMVGDHTLPDGRRVKSRMVLDADLRPVDIIMIAYDPADPTRCVRVLSRRDLVRQLVIEILAVASAVAALVWAHAFR